MHFTCWLFATETWFTDNASFSLKSREEEKLVNDKWQIISSIVMIHLLVLALRMYNIYIYHFMSFYKQIFPCLLPPSRYWFETEKHYLFLLFFFSKVFLVHLFECQLIYPSHQRPYWPLLTRLSFQAHCDYQRSFLEDHFLILILAKTIISPCVTFFR